MNIRLIVIRLVRNSVLVISSVVVFLLIFIRFFGIVFKLIVVIVSNSS